MSIDSTSGNIYCCPSCGKYLYKARFIKHPEDRVCKRCDEELVYTGFNDDYMTKEVLNGDDIRTFVYKNFLYKNPKFNPQKHEEFLAYLKSPETIAKARAELKELDERLRQEREEANKVRCPRCGSTQIQMVQRKWSLLTGIFTNKVDRVCVNCKHRW